MTFAEKVKHVRATLLISQEQLAKELGVSYVTVSRWETKEIEPQFLTKAKFDKFREEKGITFESLER